MKISSAALVLLTIVGFVAAAGFLDIIEDSKLYCPGCYDTEDDCDSNCKTGKCQKQEPICYSCYGCYPQNSTCNNACYPCEFNPNNGYWCCSKIWNDIKPCVLACGQACSPFRTKSYCCVEKEAVEAI